MSFKKYLFLLTLLLGIFFHPVNTTNASNDGRNQTQEIDYTDLENALIGYFRSFNPQTLTRSPETSNFLARELLKSGIIGSQYNATHVVFALNNLYQQGWLIEGSDGSFRLNPDYDRRVPIELEELEVYAGLSDPDKRGNFSPLQCAIFDKYRYQENVQIFDKYVYSQQKHAFDRDQHKGLAGELGTSWDKLNGALTNLIQRGTLKFSHNYAVGNVYTFDHVPGPGVCTQGYSGSLWPVGLPVAVIALLALLLRFTPLGAYFSRIDQYSAVGNIPKK